MYTINVSDVISIKSPTSAYHCPIIKSDPSQLFSHSCNDKKLPELSESSKHEELLLHSQDEYSQS